MCGRGLGRSGGEYKCFCRGLPFYSILTWNQPAEWIGSGGQVNSAILPILPPVWLQSGSPVDQLSYSHNSRLLASLTLCSLFNRPEDGQNPATGG